MMPRLMYSSIRSDWVKVWPPSTVELVELLLQRLDGCSTLALAVFFRLGALEENPGLLINSTVRLEWCRLAW